MANEDLELATDEDLIEECKDRNLERKFIEDLDREDLVCELEQRGFMFHGFDGYEDLPSSPQDLVRIFEANRNNARDFDGYLKCFVQSMDRQLNDSFVEAFKEWSLYQ